MRILHTSDWHLGRSLDQVNRMDEQREFIEHLCMMVEERNIDLVLVAGDVYDTYNPSAAAEELFYEAIDKLNGDGKRAVVVIAGNHDNPERLCAASPLAYRNGIVLLGYPGSIAGASLSGSHGRAGAGKDEKIRVACCGQGWLELNIPGCSHNAIIIALPYPSESRLEELLARDADEAALQKAYSDKVGGILAAMAGKYRDDTVNLVVAHLFLLGGSTCDSERTLQVGGALTVDPGVLPQKAHYVALGHLHRPQEIRNSPCPAFYAGSPLAYSFSEADYSKAVFIVDASPGKKTDVTPVYLDCGKPLRRWFANEGIGQAVKWCEEGRDEGAWVDLEIVTDRPFTAEEQKCLRTLHPGIINIRPRIKTGETEVFDFRGREGRKADELFRDYYKYRMGADIPGELMEAFIELIGEESGEGEGNEYFDVSEDEAESADESASTDEAEAVSISEAASESETASSGDGISTTDEAVSLKCGGWNMRPKYLEIEGLQSFAGVQKIDFEALSDTGLFGIFGPTGSGKSTILDAITFALYGRVKRAEGGTQGIINTGCSTARVSFTFTLSKDGTRRTYRVERTYQRKKNSLNSCEPKIARLIEVAPGGDIPLCDKATEVSNFVKDLIGLSGDDFTRAVVLPQNSFRNSFC